MRYQVKYGKIEDRMFIAVFHGGLEAVNVEEAEVMAKGQIAHVLQKAEKLGEDLTEENVVIVLTRFKDQ